MNKKPSLQFYPGDWWRAVDVKGCSMSTQGVWFNLQLRLWDTPETGKLVTNFESICRIIGAKTHEVNAFLRENEIHKFADISICNGIVTIINRRMYDEFLEQESTKERVRKHRLRQSNENVTPEENEKCNGNVTLHSSTSTSSSIIYTYTIGQIKDSCILNGIPESNAQSYFDQYNSQGWFKASGRPITNLQSHMAKRWNKIKQCWDFDERNKEPRFDKGGGKKAKLLPIPGKHCSERGCQMPAVYKSTGGEYDHYYCSEHMPVKVKEKYE